MSTVTPLSPRTHWLELRTDSRDWEQTDPDLLQAFLTSMILVRVFEEKVLELAGQGLVHGPAHSAIGQEAAAVGSVMAMRTSDQINGPHRAHHQFLAKAFHFLRPQGIRLSRQIDAEIREVCHRALSEILGLAQGY